MYSDEKESLRNRVATENSFQLYKIYSEREAAERVGWDYSTLKRKRRSGLVPFVDRGGGSVGYMGYHIADIILFGVKALDEQPEPTGGGRETWASTVGANTGSETGGSVSVTGRLPTTESDTTQPRKVTSALALARQTLNSPRRS